MVEINVDISNNHFKFERPNIHSLFFFFNEGQKRICHHRSSVSNIKGYTQAKGKQQLEDGKQNKESGKYLDTFKLTVK